MKKLKVCKTQNRFNARTKNTKLLKSFGYFLLFVLGVFLVRAIMCPFSSSFLFIKFFTSSVRETHSHLFIGLMQD